MADETCPTFPDEEEWRACADFPNYEVSNWGHVRRRVLIRTDGRSIKAKVLKASPANNGYPRVTLCGNDGSRIYKNVHELICATFHGPKPSAKHEVAHRDGNRTNCHWDNLRWATHVENEQDRIRHGRARKKLTADQVILIRRRLAAGDGNKAIAADFGVDKSMISRIKVGGRGAWNWLPMSG